MSASPEGGSFRDNWTDSLEAVCPDGHPVPPSYFLSPLLTPAIAAAAGLAQGEADSPSAGPFSGRLCLGLLWYPNIGCPQPALRTLSYKCTGIRTPGVTTGCQRSKQRIPPYVPPGDASGVCSTRPPRRSSAELRSKVESRSFTRVGRPRSLIPHFPGPWDHLENRPVSGSAPRRWGVSITQPGAFSPVLLLPTPCRSTYRISCKSSWRKLCTEP